MHTNKFIALSLAVVAFTGNATTVIYQWVDKNNVAHYSQQPPHGIEFKEIIVKTSMASSTPTTTTDYKTVKESSKLAEAFSNDTMAKCENARANLSKLQQFEKIESVDSEGKAKLLSDIEKLQQIKLAEKQIEVYCN